MIAKIKSFAKNLIAGIQKDDIIPAANDLTYRIFFSVFPFAIFLMSVVGFLNLNADLLAQNILGILPDIIKSPAEAFIKDMLARRSANILSLSLLAAIWSASSGFRTATRSINKAYGLRDTRKFYFKIIISTALVIIFGAIIILCLALLVFGDILLKLVTAGRLMLAIFNISRYIISFIILFFSVILINKIALFKNRATSFKNLFFGALFTCLAWIAVSALFNIYIDNFTNFSAIYGSVGAIIALMLWFNIMCLALLVGSKINAVLEL